MDFILEKQPLEEAEDETVHFWIFSYDENNLLVTNECDLQNLCASYMGHVHNHIRNYIWYKEPFSLKMKPTSSDNLCGSLGPHIGGCISVGDYLEDEWFTFYLLLQLSKKFPNSVCRIIDNDGEFLLIEAATVLPKWVNPITADRRVYLKGGLIHLVPCSVFSLSSGIPSVMDAVSAVQSKPSLTLANSAVQNAIKLRIEEYPRKISKEHHSTHAYVPVSVAALLQDYPTLVSAGVRAFCNKQSSDNKCLRVMRHFPPETRVMTSVRFSKALYALLTSRPYTPDLCTGWNIPPENNNSHIIGMKLACGFEILVCSAGGVTPVSTPEEPTVAASDPKWQKYKQSLTEKGYFRGELEGTSLHRNLEINAQRFFVVNNLMSRASKDDLEALPLGSIIVRLLSKVNADFETFKKKEKELLPPDDEKWLEVTPDTFDQLLENKFQQRSEDGTRKTSDRVTAETLNDFIKSSTSHEKANIPEEFLQGMKRKTSETSVGKSNRKTSGHCRKPSYGRISIQPQGRKISSHSNASDSSDMSSLSAKIEFNADSFTDALNNILEYSLPEDEYFANVDDSDASSGMSSYDEDDDKNLSLSRKTSGGSSSSKASSGVDCTAAPTRPQREKKSSSKKIPLAFMDDDFDLEDDNRDDTMNVTSNTHLLKSRADDHTSDLFTALNIDTPTN